MKITLILTILLLTFSKAAAQPPSSPADTVRDRLWIFAVHAGANDSWLELGGVRGAHHFDIAQWALDRDDTGPVSLVPPKDSAATSGLTFR